MTQVELNKIIKIAFPEKKDSSSSPPPVSKKPVQVSSPLKQTPAANKAKKNAEPLGGVTLAEFLSLFQDHYKSPVSEQMLAEALAVFDEDHCGRLTRTRLIEILTKQGEPLPQQEVEQLLMLANVNVKSKDLDYVALAKTLSEGPSGVRFL